MTGALTTAQQEITQYLANTEQLNSQITNLQSQVAAVVNEREGALQQATHLSTTIQDLEQKVQALEAQKDQLEQDRFTTQTALQDLQTQHDEVGSFTGVNGRMCTVRGSPHSSQISQWLQISARSRHFCFTAKCNAYSFSELQSQQYSQKWLHDLLSLGTPDCHIHILCSYI